MILRHRHLLLRLLKLRIVVNDHEIYECREQKPVVITDTKPGTFFTISNGFHSSRRMSVNKNSGLLFYEVGSFIDNIQLLTGFVLTLLFFLIFIFTGIRLFMIAANLPLLIMFILVFLKKKDFIQVHRLKAPDKLN